MPSLFEVVGDQISENHDAISSPFDGDSDADTINDRRAASENAEALRLARAL